MNPSFEKYIFTVATASLASIGEEEEGRRSLK